MELMQIQHLSKVYGQGENQVRAVDDISFTVEKGEFLAIIGPSGSGKSTLLHILGGVDCPTSGKVFVDGQDVYAQNEDQLAIFRRRQVGLIYQFYNLIDRHSVTEHTGNQFSIVPIFFVELFRQTFNGCFVSTFVFKLEIISFVAFFINVFDDASGSDRFGQ